MAIAMYSYSYAPMQLHASNSIFTVHNYVIQFHHRHRNQGTGRYTPNILQHIRLALPIPCFLSTKYSLKLAGRQLLFYLLKIVISYKQSVAVMR